MVAYIFVLLGVVRERVALTMVYLDMLLYSAGGMIGTMHHVYFSGEPAVHMALGAFFSAAEVIPLTILTLEAWSFLASGSFAAAGIKRLPFIPSPPTTSEIADCFANLGHFHRSYGCRCHKSSYEFGCR
jgi:nitric oxide reductase large subunit